MNHNRLAIIILDGWGVRRETRYNAIASAHTPFWDYLKGQYPKSLLSACGEAVGLPRGQMGNSEVGHMHIGTGQIIPQSLLQINQAIADGEFSKRMSSTVKKHAPIGVIHCVGLISSGGVHAHIDHWFETLRTLSDYDVRLHLILDGRDTIPNVALRELQPFINQLLPHHQVASISGRFYAMDRDQRWDRTDHAVKAISGHLYDPLNHEDVLQYIESSYQNDLSDEFILPKSFSNTPVQDNDLMLMMNFRPDRMVQLTQRFKDQLPVVTLTDYHLKTDILFPKQPVNVCLGSIIANAGLSQSRIAETEKYPHVTYFLNGGHDRPFLNEQRILVPSPKVTTYDQAPKMSIDEVTQKILQQVKLGTDCIIANFANADMVGHTGHFNATIEAVESIDHHLAMVYEYCKTHHYQLMICADHGNAEWMYRPEDQINMTSHTPSMIPFVYCKDVTLRPKGTLIDILPTMLTAMNVRIPTQIMGKNLILTTN